MKEDEYFQLNTIQHFVYCKRQWGLMELEDSWAENVDTRIGHYLHEKVDDINFTEKRGDKVIVRAMPIISHTLKFIGVADVVEFIKDDNGISIHNYQGLYKPYVVEYKKGKPKKDNPDISQLVAQVICIEEMFNTQVLESAIYYKQINKRMRILITEELKNDIKGIAQEMGKIYESKVTPKAKIGKNCERCSLVNHCLPRLTHHKRSVVNYVNNRIDEFNTTDIERKE